MATISELLTKFQNLVKKYHYTKSESDGLISTHNNSNDAHSDIRNSIPSSLSDLTDDSDFLTMNSIIIINNKENITNDGIYIYDDVIND